MQHSRVLFSSLLRLYYLSSDTNKQTYSYLSSSAWPPLVYPPLHPCDRETVKSLVAANINIL